MVEICKFPPIASSYHNFTIIFSRLDYVIDLWSQFISLKPILRYIYHSKIFLSNYLHYRHTTITTTVKIHLIRIDSTKNVKSCRI